MFFVLFFASKLIHDGWDSPKKMQEAKVRWFSSNDIWQLRLKRSTTAWTLRIGEWRYGKKNTLQRVALGWSNWTPLDLEQPHWDLEFFPSVHSDEWHVAACRNKQCLDDTSCVEFCYLTFAFHCGAANCAMQGREWAKERQMSGSQMSCKGWVPINVEP